jgi:putative endonuclease
VRRERSELAHESKDFPLSPAGESLASSPLLPRPRRCHRRPVTWVYILRCIDGTFYVGHTNDLDARLVAHNTGTAARYTAERRPVQIAYAEPVGSENAAIARERQLKRWTRIKKEALISGSTELRGIVKRQRQLRD